MLYPYLTTYIWKLILCISEPSLIDRNMATRRLLLAFVCAFHERFVPTLNPALKTLVDEVCGLIFMLIFAPYKSRTTISSFLIFILHRQIGWFGESKEKHLQQLAPQLAVRHFHRQKQQQRENPWKWCTSCYTFLLAEIFVHSKDRFKF